MDLEVLNKKIGTFRGEGGRVRNVSDELLMEILSAWETYKGPAKGFTSAIGVSKEGMGSLIKKAKKLKREGFPTDAFKEIKISESPSDLTSLVGGPCQGVEILWDNGKLIRFQLVEQLVDFLKKVA